MQYDRQKTTQGLEELAKTIRAIAGFDIFAARTIAILHVNMVFMFSITTKRFTNKTTQ